MGRLRVHRKGYTAKRDGVEYTVKPTSFFIEDRGAPGRGEKLFDLKKGKLEGYHLKDKSKTRHEALNTAVDKFGALSVFRSVNALSNLFKADEPKLHRVAEEDKDWFDKFRDSKRHFKS